MWHILLHVSTIQYHGPWFIESLGLAYKKSFFMIYAQYIILVTTKLLRVKI